MLWDTLCCPAASVWLRVRWLPGPCLGLVLRGICHSALRVLELPVPQ